MIRKRPEKETDPAKFPGQIINRPVDFEKPLEKQIKEYKQENQQRVCGGCRCQFEEQCVKNGGKGY